MRNRLTAAVVLCLSVSVVHAELVIENLIPVVPSNGIDVPAPTDGVGSPSGGSMISGSSGQSISFLNGDVIHGSLIKIDSDGLEWKHPDANNSTVFGTKNIKNLKLAKEVGGVGDVSMVKLSNGDVLYGKIENMNEDALRIKTAASGVVPVRRNMISMISPGKSSSGAIYEGPNRVEEWEASGNNKWKMKKKKIWAMHDNIGIGQNFDLPDMLAVDFDYEWKGSPNLYVSLYTDTLKSYSGNSYQLRISGYYIYAYRMSKNRGSKSLGQLNMRELQKKSKAKVGIRFNKKTKTMAVYIDGAMMRQWVDPDVFAGGGEGIMFWNDSSYPMALSNMKISEWDGVVHDKQDDDVKTKQDVVKFNNGDAVTGTLKEIAGQKMKFETEFATLDVPLDRVDVVTMSSENLARARRNKGDVQVSLSDGGLLTVQLKDLDEGAMFGNTENLDKDDLSFRRELITGILFNIYDDRHEPEDEEE